MNVCLAQLDRAFGYGPKGRGFESSNTRNEKDSGNSAEMRFPGFFCVSGFFGGHVYGKVHLSLNPYHLLHAFLAADIGE